MRLDHLLSKEHHETWGRPHRVGVRFSSDSLDGLCAVVAPVLVHNEHLCSAGDGRHGCQTHYWALRQQARALFGGRPGLRVWGCVLSPRLWWWGVVFDLWIVVASI